MKERFKNLFQRLTGENSIIANNEWYFICLHYNEPFRKYHNLMHITKCIDFLDNVSKHMVIEPSDFDVIEFSLYFHDIIYNPRSKTNERDSLKYVSDMPFSFPDKFIKNVMSCINATTHTKLQNGMREKLICDIDLMPLSIGWNEFYLNDLNIREEYNFISDEEFYPARSKILKSFLDRENFYQISTINHFFEKQARQNIGRLLEEYDKKSI